MYLRFDTFLNHFKVPLVKKASFFLLLLWLPHAHLLAQQSMEQIKKQAEKLYEDEEFDEAYKYYSQLVSNFPKDPEYNYRLGVCMIYSEPDKKKCLTYLKQASLNKSDTPKDLFFYLGKAYHINYLFDDAIKSYNEFKSTASASLQKKLQVDKEIRACNNGKKLLSNLPNLEIKAKKQLNEADYFRTYDLKTIGGRLLSKPEEFRSSIDKKKKEKSIVYYPKNSSTVFYSSYGQTPETGKDIYMITKTDKGFVNPQKITTINSEFDEDYPFLHPNGKTLYFASKGFNSMGGYDIFKSTFDENSRTWGAPENLQFPINSPDDDYLFVTDSLEQNATFSTGRQSPPGKIDVLKIITERVPIDVLAIKGIVKKETDNQGVASFITLKNMQTNVALGVIAANDEGKYKMELPNGSKILYSVETPGVKTQTAEVEVPLTEQSKPLKQEITYEKGRLKIINYFDESPDEESYLEYLDVIEKKAKLEITAPVKRNNKKPEITAAVEDSLNKITATSKPTIVSEINEEAISSNENKTDNNANEIDKKQLANNALNNANKDNQEAKQFERDAKSVLESGRGLMAEAIENIEVAEKDIKTSEAVSVEAQRTQMLANAKARKKTAQKDSAAAQEIIAYGLSLEAEAKAKQTESETNQKQAEDLLNKSIAENNENSVPNKDLSANIATKTKTQTQKAQTNTNSKNISAKETKNPTEVLSSDELSEKYASKVILKNNPDKNQLEENNILLSHYNLEIDNAIKSNKQRALKSKNPEEKKSINKEIASLQNLKSQNLNQVNSNKERSAALEDSDNKNLGLIEASGPEDAIQKIEDLKTQMQISDNENFDFNSYQTPEAQAMKVDADSRINDAIARQKKLKNELEQASQNLKNSNGLSTNKSDVTLITEADAYHEKALRLENEARGKQGAQKTKLLADAKKLDDKANETYIAASKQTEVKNQKALEINQENIANLIQENKSPETEITECQKLIEEANSLFKQSQTIRTETYDITNYSVKLGKLFNAEEKEGEALQKQKQALDILKKSNPDFVLKTNEASAKSNTDSAPNSVQEILTALNKSINEVADIKIDAYSKLSAANTTEVDTLSEKISENIEMIYKNPKQKSDMISANNKLVASKKLMTQANADTSSNKSKKISLLIAAVKKQNEALKQLNDISNALNPIASQPPTVQNSVTPTPIVQNDEKIEPEIETEENDQNNNKQIAAETKLQVEKNETTIENNVEEAQPNPAEVQEKITNYINSPAIKADTSTKQILNYLNDKPQELNNPAASKMYQASLAQIKKYEIELKNFESNGNNAPIVVDLEQAQVLKSKSETLTRDADNLTIQSIETRKEAKGKEGIEKENIINKANEQENEALSKNIDGAELMLQSNEIIVQNNANILGAYLNKLKSDDEGLYSEINNKNAELITLGSQVKKLREEASEMSSKGAKFGALSNAEEREAELLQKQSEIITQLKTKYPDFVYEPSEALAVNNIANPENDQKRSLIIKNQQDELTKLTNALRLEFETKKYSVPIKLNAEQSETRDLIIRLNAESKRLLVQSAQQKDEATKTKYLSQAAKYASEVLLELNKIAKPSQVTQIAKNNIAEEEQTIEVDNNTNETETKKPAPKKDNFDFKKPNAEKNLVKEKKPKQVKPLVNEDNEENEETTLANETPIPKNLEKNIGKAGNIRVEGLEVKTANAYSEDRPIPVDAKIEDGLIFRVQIGAFKNKLPNNTFKGLSPLNAETTPNGFLRYTAGNFNKFELANAVKNDLRSLGYSDAFVVGFYNGKRLGLSEALDILTKEGKMIDRNAMQTAGITLNANIPRAAVNPVIMENMVVSKQIEKVNGLLFTIQVGVYNKQVTKQQLFNLRPIFSEELPSGLFRFAAGIYNNVDRLLADKRKVNELGLRDAFVTAYLNGKRIGFGEAKDKQTNDSTIKMETEEPVIFPSADEIINPTPLANIQNITPVFNNGVKNYPAPTAENGVKSNEQGICFKVQIGAYSKQVPNEVASKFNQIKNWPVENKKITNLYIYNIGNFSSVKFAKQLKEEAISLGLNDAFIAVYNNGTKLYGAEASNYLNQ
jgi:hypothetical protein